MSEILFQSDKNPYDYDNAVSTPSMFFGRESELSKLIPGLTGTGARSFALVGGRRFGKTSLLRAVERGLNRSTLRNNQRLACIPVFLDMHKETITSRADFFRVVLQRVCRHAVNIEPESADNLTQFVREIVERSSFEMDPVPGFERVIAHAQLLYGARNLSLRVVILLDESERLLAQADSKDLLQNLRALLSNTAGVTGTVRLVMAGSTGVLTATETGSPLHNILNIIPVSRLSPDATISLIQTPCEGAVTAEIANLIEHKTGGHPCLVQFIMHNLWERGIVGLSRDDVDEIMNLFREEKMIFWEWVEDIGTEGMKVIEVLIPARHGTTARLIASQTGINLSVLNRLILPSLAYHGLASKRRSIIDTSPESWVLDCVMFREWYQEMASDADDHSDDIESTLVDSIIRHQQVQKLADTEPANSVDYPSRTHKLAHAIFSVYVGTRIPSGYPTRYHGPSGDISGTIEAGLLEHLTPFLEKIRNNSIESRELGRYLFEVLLGTHAEQLYRTSLEQARSHKKRLRVSLHIESPDLASVPWELMFDPIESAPLSISAETPLVRYIPMQTTARTQSVKPPLHLLIVIANPHEQSMQLNTQRELESIKKALSSLINSGQILLQILPHATLPDLIQALREFNPHALHFIGHGEYRDNIAYILLEDSKGNNHRVGMETFRDLFTGHSAPKWAVLNICESATVSLTQLLTGLAPQLLQRGLASVVAMQYPIEDENAAIFSREFYSSLAVGYEIDMAVSEARKTLFLIRGANSNAWAAPVLFMRSEQANLFET